VSGGLSLLLVLALAFAAGVPAGQLLATVGGSTGHGEFDRAVAPQVVERQSRQLQQERPLAIGSAAQSNGLADSRTIEHSAACLSGRPETLVREALLALPPPARC
jgi:hypothetical protein